MPFGYMRISEHEAAMAAQSGTSDQAILAHMHERTGLKCANRLLEHNNKNLVAENARLKARLAPFEQRVRGNGGRFTSASAVVEAVS